MNIGKTIADLRKQKNMTQSEVADVLGVTYQAVSKWERDESLPDIALLPAIADLFGISIDQLLRGGFEMGKDEVECAKDIIEESQKDFDDEITQLVNESFEEGNPSCDELSESISNYMDGTFSKTYAKTFENLMPMMKPNKIKKVADRIKVNMHSFSKKAYNYLDNDTIDVMLNQMEEVDEDVFDILVEIVSGANSSTRDLVVDKLCNCDLSGLELAEIMPYLNSNQKNLLLIHILDHQYADEEQIIEILPYLSSQNKDLLCNYFDQYDFDEDLLSDLITYLNASQKEKLVDYLCENTNDIELDEIFPYLNHHLSQKLILSKLNQLSFEELTEYACYLGKDTIHQIICEYINQESEEDISELYPYMNQESKEKLIKYYLENKMIDELQELYTFM
ncbi:MAG: helix-turn-helix domain-containing protein [Traorella sp.]